MIRRIVREWLERHGNDLELKARRRFLRSSKFPDVRNVKIESMEEMDRVTLTVTVYVNPNAE